MSSFLKDLGNQTRIIGTGGESDYRGYLDSEHTSPVKNKEKWCRIKF